MPIIRPNNNPQPPALAVGAPTDPTTPVTPHVQMPFAFGSNGRPTYCDQDSVEDVQSCVMNLFSCPQGDNPYDDSFGRPDYRGESEPLQTQALLAQAQTYEPRLESVSVTEADNILGTVVQLAFSGSIGSS